MENREKRARGSKWNHAQTVALAELKRVIKEHGRLVWDRIAQTLSSRFPDQIRTGKQCRRRWDTLVKAYNHIEEFCVVTGQDHRELNEGELASMKLATAYHQDWYDIMEQFCSQVSQRKRKERCDDDPMPGKLSKSSHSVEHPEHPPNRDTLCSAPTSKSATCREQSTPESSTTYAQVFCSSSLEADKLSPEEEVPRLKHGNDGLMLEQPITAYAQVSSSPSFVLEATQLRQHGQVSHEVSQELQEFPGTWIHSLPEIPWDFEFGDRMEEPEDDLWDPARDSCLWTFALEGYRTETNDSDSTIPRKSQVRWLKVILVFRICRFAFDCKEKLPEDSSDFKKGKRSCDVKC